MGFFLKLQKILGGELKTCEQRLEIRRYYGINVNFLRYKPSIMIRWENILENILRRLIFLENGYHKVFWGVVFVVSFCFWLAMCPPPDCQGSSQYHNV